MTGQSKRWEEEAAQLRGLWSGAAQAAARWRLTLGRPYRVSPASLVLAAERSDGLPAVLKIPLLDEENSEEAAALEVYGGDGAVLLYQADPATGALLLEQLTPGTALADHPDRDGAIGIACGLLRHLRRSPGPGHPFPLVRDLALRWAKELPVRQAIGGYPDAAPLADKAASLARGLAELDRGELLVNRDAHLGNILAAQRMTWLLIDPKPLVGDGAFDAGWLLLELLEATTTDAEAARLAARLSAELAVDPVRVSGWAFIRAVEAGIGLLETGSDPSHDFAQARRIGAFA